MGHWWSFLFDDLVSDYYSAVRFFLRFDECTTPPLPNTVTLKLTAPPTATYNAYTYTKKWTVTKKRS